jgi:SpoVK/Ycf46/Vps4 family AAA+-type ATPase
VDPLLESLRAAVEAAPDDDVLRLHFASQLAARGQRDDAVREAATVLQRDPGNSEALRVIAGTTSQSAGPGGENDGGSRLGQSDDGPTADNDADTLAALDAEMAGIVPPMFVDGGESGPFVDAYDVSVSAVRLADVGGMTDVKRRLEAAFLAPMRNPELARTYGKSMRGGLLMYGPPGCGKTFLARAVAGELQAKFLAVSLADVLDMWVGSSERNVHDLFELARQQAPCVIFLDEVDAIGQKRSRLQGAMRGAVNQLLTEMDGIGSTNEGVFVLGATNHPWDVDTALRRPGRFDRMVLVSPPDQEARAAILRYHLSSRPVAGIDITKVARATNGLSGADLAYVCELATERALLDSAASGVVRLIEQRDLEAAMLDVRPSIGPWLETARNVVEFANPSGEYDDLRDYLRRSKSM